MLESDLLDIMMAVTEERLSDVEISFAQKSACCVIMASKGYPESYEKGFEITIPDELWDKVYVAGAKLEDGKLLTNGGRVLGVTETSHTLAEAVHKAYKDVEKIHFDNEYYRKDIGRRALNGLQSIC